LTLDESDTENISPQSNILQSSLKRNFLDKPTAVDSLAQSVVYYKVVKADPIREAIISSKPSGAPKNQEESNINDIVTPNIEVIGSRECSSLRVDARTVVRETGWTQSPVPRMLCGWCVGYFESEGTKKFIFVSFSFRDSNIDFFPNTKHRRTSRSIGDGICCFGARRAFGANFISNNHKVTVSHFTTRTRR
jgi:hypothetical protein